MKVINNLLLLMARLRSALKPTRRDCFKVGDSNAPMRLLVIANAIIPTVQLSLLSPLEKAINNKSCSVEFLTEQQMKERFGKALRSNDAWEWIKNECIAAKATHVIFCRYSGPHAEALLDFFHDNLTPSIYCIDDDLLNVPRELGQQKFDFHNHPLRLNTVRYLLNNVNLVYCSNSRLLSRLQEIGINGNLYAGKIFCAGEIISPAELRNTKTIGYMGFDHAHDFEIVLPALVKVLQQYSELQFEIFGKIPKPAVLNEFGDRIVMIPTVADYSDFLKAFASRRWDIGICPLAPTHFNQVKNINKWIEYTSVGTAVIASRGLIYDDCCSDSCGLLATTTEEWLQAFEKLITNNEARFQLVSKAQNRLEQDYSLHSLQNQVMDMLHQAVKQSHPQIESGGIS